MNRVVRLLPFALLAALLLPALPAVAQDDGLVATLAKGLAVTPQQAEGGAGLLMNYAKGALGADDFGKLATSLPEVTTLAEAGAKLAPAAAPALGGSGGGANAMLGAAAGAAMAGGGGASPLGIMSLAGSFEKLGLSSDMVGKFAPAIVDYATKKGGDAPALLAKAFGLASQ